MELINNLISGNAGIGLYILLFGFGLTCDYYSDKVFQSKPFILGCSFLVSYKTHDWTAGVSLAIGYGVELSRFKALKEIVIGIFSGKRTK